MRVYQKRMVEENVVSEVTCDGCGRRWTEAEMCVIEVWGGAVRLVLDDGTTVLFPDAEGLREALDARPVRRAA